MAGGQRLGQHVVEHFHATAQWLVVEHVEQMIVDDQDRYARVQDRQLHGAESPQVLREPAAVDVDHNGYAKHAGDPDADGSSKEGFARTGVNVNCVHVSP